ncbi:MAG TPA: hypothetical protein VI111_08435 [Thermoleophilaceae bacterium]
MFRSTPDTARLSHEHVTVRHATVADAPALARLAALDSTNPPRGPALIAEVGSRPLAALPLGSGRPVADPFEPTAELVALLELRAAQLEAGDPAPRRSLAQRLRGWRRTLAW